MSNETNPRRLTSLAYALGHMLLRANLDRDRWFRAWCCGFLSLCLALLLPLLALAETRFDRLHSQAWSTEQGLPQNSVHRVYQDHLGFIWLATEGGIARFDGVSFRTFDRQHETAFTSDDACCLTEDTHQDLWIGTADGLIRLHRQSFARLSEKEGLPSSVIRGLLTDADGTLLALTAGGLVRWMGNRFEAVPQAPPDVESMERRADGGVWLLAKGQVFLLRNGSVSAGSADLPKAALKGVGAGAGGALWTFSNTEVERRGSGPAARWQVGKKLPGTRVQSLFVDRADDAWVGTDDGVAVIGKDAVEAVEVPSLHGNSVLQTFEDREGNHWIGTESSGLYLLRSLVFRTAPAPANKAVTAIVQDSSGATWLGTRQDALLRVRHGQMEHPVRPESLTSPLILSLAAGEDGSVWAGTPDGLNHVDAKGNVRRWTSADGLPDDYIQALARDTHGCVWAGTRQGLASLCGSRMAVLTKKDGLSGDLIGTLLVARTGELWIGTSGGLSRRDLDGKLTANGVRGDRPQGIVSAMAEDAVGRIWIATRNGDLSRMIGGTARAVKGDRFQGDILAMVADNRGSLWLRRERGVDRVAIADVDRCADAGTPCLPHVSHYGIADGLPSEEMTPTGSPGLWLMTDGELWVGTRRGVGIADTGRLPRNPVPPGVAIESFLVDGVAQATDGSPLTLPYGHLRFTIEYAGLSFVASSEVRYRFRLEGLESEWTEAGTRRSATYTNLPSRSFRFQVQAMNNDGVWNQAGATLSFRIVPPFYRRWWFLALLALLMGALATGLYRLRLRRLQTQFEAVLKERNRMAREIHDTLAQDFVGVTLQLDLIAQMLGMKKIEAAVQQVRQARRLVTEGLAEARQSIWELRAHAGTESLPTRLGKVVERYTGERPVIRTKIGGAFRAMDPRVETEVLRVAQEALSNVQRHAQANNASVELYYGRDTLVLTIVDDGRGFAMDQASGSRERYGLSGLKERASLLGGTLQIASAPGQGTRIILTTGIISRKDGAA